MEKDVNVIGNFVFEFNLITFTMGVQLILFSNLICNHLWANGKGEDPMVGLCWFHMRQQLVTIYQHHADVTVFLRFSLSNLSARSAHNRVPRRAAPRGRQFYFFFAVLQAFSVKHENELFLPQDLQPREGNPMKHRLSSESSKPTRNRSLPATDRHPRGGPTCQG